MRFDSLRRKNDFERVYRKGTKHKGKSISILADNVPENEGSKVSIVISGKFGNSVKRNRARRLIREALRSLKVTMGGAWNMIILPGPNLINAGVNDLETELLDLFGRAGAINRI